MRIVNHIPLDRLWDQKGDLEATRKRWLSMTSLRELLQNGRVTFYIADCGHPLQRVDESDCFEFWKTEVNPHLVNDPNAKFSLEDYPGEYAYLASEWSGESETPIVLLEKHH